MIDVFTDGYLYRKHIFPGVEELRTASDSRLRIAGVKLRPRTWSEMGYKLGASYNLYDGEELLKASCRSIRASVDHITVVYQDVSNIGERRTESVHPLLEELKDVGLIDSMVKYTPDLSKPPAWNERMKRLIGYSKCGEYGCTHHLDMDVDEFYRPSEFERAKRFIYGARIDISAAPFWYYVKSPLNRIRDCRFFVPFIFKRVRTMPPFVIRDFPCIVDDTRVFRGTGRFHMFRCDEISMHHMSGVRINLDKKYRNSTASATAIKATKSCLDRVKHDIENYSFGGHPFPENLDYMNGQVVERTPDEFGIGEF